MRVIASPAEQLLYVPSAGTFTITGDVEAFRDTFGPAYPVVRFFHSLVVMMLFKLTLRQAFIFVPA